MFPNRGKQVSFFLLLLIIIVAAILRFYNYSDLSMTGDEISVLHRLRFDSFEELIDYGVRIDGHPAGVQVFMYYWTSLFGTTEEIFRLPYVICGILSVLFSYLIGAAIFNRNTGLWFAASVCFLQFPLIYSQIGRPYSPGLCFTLLSTWLWYLVLFKPKRRYWLKIICYGFSVALAIYCHYFSFFQVLLIGLTGLFFLNKQNRKGFILSGLLSFVLFLPHFGVSVDHLQIGGLREAAWLGSPDQDPNWFVNYIVFGFNNSLYVVFGFLGICLATVIRYGVKAEKSPFRLLCFIWFIVPFLVGYFYSVLVNPVLQRSVLLFSFPFFVLLLFSFMPKIYSKSLMLLLILFLISGCTHTICVNRFYENNFFGVLKEIVAKTHEYNQRFGKENISKTINVGHPLFVEYYSKRSGIHAGYTPYVADNEAHKYRNNGKKDLAFFINMTDTAKTNYFLYAWSSKYSPNEIPEIIKEKYPHLVDRIYFFNSEIYLFAKYDSINAIKEVPLFNEKIKFNTMLDNWTYPDNYKTQMLIYDNDNPHLRLSASDEFSPCFTKRVGDIMKRKDNLIHVTLQAKLSNLSEAVLVVALEDNKGKQYLWRGMKLNNFIMQENKWEKVFHSLRFYDIYSSDDILKVYVWNSGKGEVFVDDIQITVTAGNPKIYGKNDYTLK